MVPWACWMLPAMALAATPSAGPRSPAEELDAELARQISIPEPELVVVTDGPDPDRFELLDATVELDGRPLPGPVEPGWGKPFFRGPLVPGNHVLTAQFAYRGSKTGAFPWSGSYVYRVPGKVEFQAQRGLRLLVHLRVEVHEDQEDPRNRLAFRAALEPEMTAKLDDGPVPPPPPRKVTPEELFSPKLEPPASTTGVASVPPAPVKSKKRPPRKKKTSVAVASGASLDTATARLQKAIATPAPPPPEPKAKTPSSGKSTRAKPLPDAGPLQD